VLVRVVQGVGNPVHNDVDGAPRHSSRVTLTHRSAGVEAADVFTRKPESTFEFAPIERPRDVGMFEFCGAVDILLEAVAEISICRHIGMQNLQSYLLRRSRLLGEIDVACPPRPQQSHYGESSESRAVRQRHGRIVTPGTTPQRDLGCEFAGSLIRHGVSPGWFMLANL
jgi:hypothetical protein